jgi:ribosomal protein S3
MLEGYKIECRGMFVRRHSNRSQSFIVQRGNVSINNRSENVEYLKKNITLRTGACSVRVWLLRKHDNTILEA